MNDKIICVNTFSSFNRVKLSGLLLALVMMKPRRIDLVALTRNGLLGSLRPLTNLLF